MTIPFGSRVVYAGDSITAQALGSIGSNKNWAAAGYAFWTQIASGHRLYHAINSNAGVAGDTSTQLLARYATDVIAKEPKVVVLLIGSKDVTDVTNNQVAATATCIANLSSMLASNRAIGATTIFIKLLPRGSVASPLTANQIFCWEAVNNWIATQAASDCLIADCESAIGNNDAAHTIKAGWTTNADNLHPLVQAAQPVGTIVGALINQVVASGDFLFTTSNDSRNLFPNGFMAGNSAGVATGYSTNPVLGGATFTPSKVTRSDGYGEWQQLALSGTYTGNSKVIELSYTIDLTGVLFAGDVCEYFCEIDASAFTGISAMMLQSTVGGQLIRVGAFSTGDVLPGNFTGAFRTTPLTLAADAGSTKVSLSIYFIDTATNDPISATIKVGRWGFRKAPLSRIVRATWT